MQKENLEQQIENHLKRFEQAVDLPFFNEQTGEKMKFIRDGIIDVAEYLKAPIKILWILKEANSSDNSLDEMRVCLKKLHNDNNNIDVLWGPTWRPIAYATYGIFEDMNFADIPEMNGNAQEVLKYMPSIAHINVKKYAGGSSENQKEVQQFYSKYKELIHEQMEVINPDILIFGGTFGYFEEYFEGVEKVQERLFPIYQWNNKLLIDTYHPNGLRGARIKQEEYCDEIINAVRKWKQKTQKQNAERLTGGLAQAGQWLARKFVRIWKFCARPNGSESPACAKPLERCRQCGESVRTLTE